MQKQNKKEIYVIDVIKLFSLTFVKSKHSCVGNLLTVDNYALTKCIIATVVVQYRHSLFNQRKQFVEVSLSMKRKEFFYVLKSRLLIPLYNNQISARALIGQSAVGYCAHGSSSELLYKSNRPQVSMGYKLINHAGCW